MAVDYDQQADVETRPTFGSWALVVAAGYVAIRLVLTLTRAVHSHPDTESYREGVSLIGGAPRPWVVPLVLEVFGDRGFTILQTVVSAVAFCALAWTVGATMRDRRVGWAIAALILLLGLTPRVTTWDQMLISESLAVSATAFLFVALVRLDTNRWWAVVPAFAVWVFVRDGHLFIGVFVLAGVGVWGWRQRKWLIPALFAGVVVWGGVAAQNDDYVESFNVAANLGGRPSLTPDDYRWFFDHGAPPSAAFNIPDTRLRIRALHADPEFHQWAASEGTATYVRFLVTHPSYLVDGLVHLFKDVQTVESFESTVDHTLAQTIVVGDPPGPSFVWPKQGSWFTLVLVLVAMASVLAMSRAQLLDRRWLIPGLAVATTPVHAMLVWNASPYELARHGVVLTFVLVVSCWWLIALAVDAQITAQPATS